MRIFFSFLLFLSLWAAPLVTMAQEAALAPDDNSVEVNKENVTDLIDTIEDEGAREEFIKNLKTLVEADDELNEDKKESLPVLSEALGINDGASSFIQSYERFLDRYNLNSSTLGKLLVSVIATAIACVLLVIIRKIGLFLRNRVMRLQQNLGLRHTRFRFYSRLLRYFAYVVIGALYIYTLNIIWEVANLGFLTSEGFGAVAGDLSSIALVLIVAIVLWEIINAFLDNLMHRADFKDSARLNTIMPIIRNVLFMTFMVMFTLVLLSELGIDIVPLMAGAGIVGIAIGFGAQTVVKDFLTGFTIVFEDLIHVGDVASMGGKTGLIEKITIRKVQLRDLNGIVYTIPFSDVGIIENWTKDFSFYVMNIGVAYREDTDEVIKALKEVDEDLRNDIDFKELILEPLEILGVDAFTDSAVIIKARIKTKPIQQWNVGREFNRRMKYKFDEYGIEIPFPHQTVYFGVDKHGHAPSAPVQLVDTPDDKEQDKPKPKKSTKASKSAQTDKTNKPDN